MKKWKFTFASIIVIVAVGCTIAVQAGLIYAKPLRVADCFRPPYELQRGCFGSSFTVEIGSLCNAVQVGDHVFELSTTLIDPAVSCFGGAYICCIRIVADNAPCFDQPTIDPFGPFPTGRYKVSQVFCKATAN